jgi:predicted transcriptional regulator YdeE
VEFQVVEKEELKVIGIAMNGSYSQMNMIPALFDQMEARIYKGNQVGFFEAKRHPQFLEKIFV